MSDPARLLAAARYAAERHHGQRRKGAADLPYVMHVFDVARRLAEVRPDDETLILGAILHDVVEDTSGTREEIASLFGEDVASLVMEVTDDKSLPKARRKELQVKHVPHLSDAAKRLKFADKASNLTAIVDAPPDWDDQRKRAYADWAEQVMAGARGLDPELEAAFDAALAGVRADQGIVG